MADLDSEDLPPLEYAVLELLGARFRLGHDGWTLHTKVIKTVRSLESRGLVTWKYGVTEKSLLVWLTETGKKAVLSEGYVPPKVSEVFPPALALNDECPKCGHVWAAHLTGQPCRVLMGTFSMPYACGCEETQ